MRYFYRAICATILFLFISMTGSAQNALSAKEKSEGWKLLFDGKSTTGWRNYQSDKVTDRWKVSNGELYLDKSVTAGAGARARSHAINAQLSVFAFMIRIWAASIGGVSGAGSGSR